MRIPSLMAVLVVGFSLVGCGRAQPPQEDQDTTPAATEQVSAGGPTAQATCPSLWTCNDVNYYTKKADCTAACGSTACYRDFVCNGGCVCP